jgi:hypothetical protein
MKHLFDQVSIYIHNNFEAICGASIGTTLGIKQIALTTTEELTTELILQKLILVTICALLGGIFGALGKWLIEEIKTWIKNEQKR